MRNFHKIIKKKKKLIKIDLNEDYINNTSHKIRYWVAKSNCKCGKCQPQETFPVEGNVEDRRKDLGQ